MPAETLTSSLSACDNGLEADFPNGIPTLCASLPTGISGDYDVDTSIELPYNFDLTLSSNEVVNNVREIILLTTQNNEGETTRYLAVPCTFDEENEVVVTMLDENMQLPDRPIVTLT